MCVYLFEFRSILKWLNRFVLFCVNFFSQINFQGEVTFKVSEKELDEHLSGLVDWERFALHLPRISAADIATIKRDNPLNNSNQKISLYEKWLRFFPQASWDNVIDALEKADEYTIAKQIQTKLQKETVSPFQLLNICISIFVDTNTFRLQLQCPAC